MLIEALSIKKNPGKNWMPIFKKNKYFAIYSFLHWNAIVINGRILVLY